VTHLLLSLRSEDVSVRCAVVFNGHTELGEDSEALVEPGSAVEENPNGPKLKYIVANALRQETSLPLDLQTLSFEAGKRPVDHIHILIIDAKCWINQDKGETESHEGTREQDAGTPYILLN
jgi:hypothetical protein